VVPPGQIEAVEEVVHPEPFPVEVIEIDPSTLHAASEDETGDVGGSGDENPGNDESQLSEKARGKKRMREEDEKDDSEALEDLLGGGRSSGSGTSTSDRDGQPDRKRMKTGTDTRINTDRLEVDEPFLIVARMGLFETLTDVESCRQVKKLKEIEKLHRSGRRRLLS
jgi:hypothetical protein